MNLQLGDKIKWSPYEDKIFLGKVINISDTEIIIEFEDKSSEKVGSFKNFYKLSSNIYTFSFLLHKEKEFSLVEISTKEEKICRKIRTLWNNSNYTKNNPQYAY